MYTQRDADRNRLIRRTQIVRALAQRGPHDSALSRYLSDCMESDRRRAKQEMLNAKPSTTIQGEKGRCRV